MEELYPNYLWRVPVTEDITDWNKLWPGLEQQILEMTRGKVPVNVHGGRTTTLYYTYNIFTFQYPVIDELKQSISNAVNKLHPDQRYYIRGWLNVMRDQEILHWHGHLPGVVGAMHGYLSITSEPSVTVYRIDKDLVNVKNRNGHAVIGYCDRDQHRTTPMPSEHPRISVAFDIAPATTDMITEFPDNKWVLL